MLAKCEHAKKVKNLFTHLRDARCMWLGTQAITDYRTPLHVCNTDASHPDSLNSNYARFEAPNIKLAQKTTPCQTTEGCHCYGTVPKKRKDR